MSNIQIFTEGKPIQHKYSKLCGHHGDSKQRAYTAITVGNAELTIHFDTWLEMQTFCLKHNFPFTDEREPKRDLA